MVKDTITKDIEALLNAAAAVGMTEVCKVCGGDGREIVETYHHENPEQQACSLCHGEKVTYPYKSALAWVQAQPDYEAVYRLDHQAGYPPAETTEVHWEPVITVFAALALMRAADLGKYQYALAEHLLKDGGDPFLNPHDLLRAMLTARSTAKDVLLDATYRSRYERTTHAAGDQDGRA